MMNIIKAIPAMIGGVAAYLWGPWDALIIVLIVVVVLDYITGVISASIRKTVSSSVGFTGILRKVFIFALVALAAMLDKLIPATNDAVRAAVIMFYIANEGISILENAGEIGLPLPQVLKNTLDKLSNSNKTNKNI
ncbi:MAG: phage holin family protein [Clostridia bacterium]